MLAWPCYPPPINPSIEFFSLRTLHKMVLIDFFGHLSICVTMAVHIRATNASLALYHFFRAHYPTTYQEQQPPVLPDVAALILRYIAGLWAKELGIVDAVHIPFPSMARTIPVTPMAITMTTIAKETVTAGTITSNPRLLLPAHVQPMLRPPSKMARLVLPPQAPTCAICLSSPLPPCERVVTTANVVGGLTLPSPWPPILVRSSIAVRTE
uniref:Uncharacterized protein n=1 Tax=Romanomermis culicivorax TaxID=13658 RepID=A0A915J8M8_ROMCU